MRHPDNQDPNYEAGRALAALAGGTLGMLSPTATRAQAIMPTVLAMNLLGDGLRDALDPRLKV